MWHSWWAQGEVGRLCEVPPNALFTQGLVLSSGSGSVGPNQSTLQPHHGHACAWLCILLMHTLILTHELASQPDHGPASSPVDLPGDLGCRLCLAAPSRLPCSLHAGHVTLAHSFPVSHRCPPLSFISYSFAVPHQFL